MKENRLKKLRELHDYEIRDVSKRIGVTEEFLEAVEQGKEELTATGISLLAVLYQTTSDYILGLTDNLHSVSYQNQKKVERNSVLMEFHRVFGKEGFEKMSDILGDKKSIQSFLSRTPEENVKMFTEK